jgi:hypothetical protein
LPFVAASLRLEMDFQKVSRMSDRVEAFIVLTIAIVQLAGLICMVLTRIYAEGPARAVFQRLFYVSLLAVGGAALASITLRSQYGFSCGLTLAIMALGATLDLRRAKNAPAF